MISLCINRMCVRAQCVLCHNALAAVPLGAVASRDTTGNHQAVALTAVTAAAWSLQAAPQVQTSAERAPETSSMSNVIISALRLRHLLESLLAGRLPKSDGLAVCARILFSDSTS